jgi:class 3 adenylate cyclase
LAERRQVTVFFSDLSGYTPLSEQLDPEDLRETMSHVFAAAGRIVEQYGGRIDKLLGDGVLAVFGDPVGHEDDPERAVRAVLAFHTAVDEISEQLEPRIGRPIALHSGIASGVVLTGQADAAGGAGPLGDPVNVASRLQSIAAPGQILIAPETHRMTAGTFEVKHLGPQQLKGKAEPIDVTEVIGIASERTRQSRVRGDFVGRQEELGVLLAAAERLRDGEPSIISVCAEAGAGKTRLLEEFRSRLSDDVAWFEGRAYPYGQNIPYSAVIDLINRVLGIDEGDTSETLRQKLADGMTAFIGNVDDDVLAPLAWLYALELPNVPPIDREAYQPALVNAVRRLIDVQSRAQPTVICLQDLHWADPSTVSLLHELASGEIPPVLFVCNFRPEFTLGAERERPLNLDELSSRQSAQLVTSLLGSVEPPAELTAFIEGHTDGNPFFIEEIINRLIETGTLARSNGSWELVHRLDHIEMPSTIRGVIQARIDHLDTEQRRLLREASVVGREFLYRVVSRVCSNTTDIDVGLSELETADLIRQKAPDPDLEYFFKHALTQEVAYEGLVRGERQELHARVGEAIEGTLADRAGEFVETLAYHYVRAGDSGKAVHYLSESGKKCLDRYALAEAAEYFTQAYELLAAEARTPETKRTMVELIVEWSLLLYYEGAIAEWLALLRTHLADAEEVASGGLLAMYLGWMGNAQFVAGEVEESLPRLRRAVALAESAGDRDAESHARAWLSYNLAEPGDVRSAIEFGRATTYRPELISRDPYALIKGTGGVMRAALTAGDVAIIREVTEEMLELARTTGNARAEVFAHLGAEALAFLTFDNDLAVESGRAAVDAARDPIYGAFAAYGLAAAAAAALDLDLARSVVAEWLPRAKAGGNYWASRGLEIFEGLLAVAEGDLSRGMRASLAAKVDLEQRGFTISAMQGDFAHAGLYVAIARREGTQPPLSAILRNPGFVAKHVIPARRKGRRLIDDLIARSRANGWGGLLPRIELYSAQLYECVGDRDGSLRELESVHRYLDEQQIHPVPKLVADFEALLG